MGNILYFFDDCTRDYLGYGVISKCPNCNSLTILSYPTTQCSQCQNRFRNDITAMNVYTYTTFCGHKKIGIKYGQRSEEPNYELQRWLSTISAGGSITTTSNKLGIGANGKIFVIESLTNEEYHRFFENVIKSYTE